MCYPDMQDEDNLTFLEEPIEPLSKLLSPLLQILKMLLNLVPVSVSQL
jgi:hypothetical protein